MKISEKDWLRRLENRYWRLADQLDNLERRFNEVFVTKTELKK